MEYIKILNQQEKRKIEKKLKAVANIRRLGIIKCLKTEKRAAVGQIAHIIKLSFRSTSKHLAILKAADIVESSQQGFQAIYTLKADQHPLVKNVRDFI